MGYSNYVNGYAGVALGYIIYVSGYYAVALGRNNTASDYASTVIGQYNSSGVFQQQVQVHFLHLLLLLLSEMELLQEVYRMLLK
ncbi:MAG: hypothetical protein CM15mP36_16720 [Flavobacteriales bacterium]|nr:MAG: hypothetical protein CM15mP36_16720 [Flavobacteriales bacterium]